MYGYEELRLCERQHELELLLTGVAGDMHLIHPLVNDGRAGFHQLIDDLGDVLLVAGDRRCRDDDEIQRRDVDLLVVVHRHAGERTHRLALGTGRDEHDLLRRVLVHVLDVDDGVLRYLEIAQLQRRRDDVDHAASQNGDLSAVLCCHVDDLLDAVDIRGEGRDDDALALCLRKELVEGFTDLPFCRGIARTLGIGGIRHQRKNASVSKLTEASQINGAAVDGRIIDLEVARMDENARRGMDRHADRIRDGVVDLDELDCHAAHADGLARLDGIFDQPCRCRLCSSSLCLMSPKRQAGAVDRRIDLFEQVCKTADVILVSVRDDDAAELILVALHIGEIRDNEIHAGHFRIRERQTAVEDEHIVCALEHGHILADLVESAQERHADRRFRRRFLLSGTRLFCPLYWQSHSP